MTAHTRGSAEPAMAFCAWMDEENAPVLLGTISREGARYPRIPSMAHRYIQRIALSSGKARWIGWEVDGVGTEIPGLTLADDLSDEELRERGVKNFVAMPFEEFLNLGAAYSRRPTELHDQDIEYRFDALRVMIDRMMDARVTDVTKAALKAMFSGVSLADPRIQAHLLEWENAGYIQIRGWDECYFRVVRRIG